MITGDPEKGTMKRPITTGTQFKVKLGLIFYFTLWWYLYVGFCHCFDEELAHKEPQLYPLY